MIQIRGLLIAIAVAVVTFGCAAPCAVNVPAAPLVATPTKISATGYGSSASYGQYTAGQQKLMAMRAAQVDAYRNLAERVHGFRVTGNTAISAFATQSDTIRSYVDSFIRGAKVVGVIAVADGNYEATVELELTPQFLSCVQNYSHCGQLSTQTTCGTAGCGYPSSIYISN